MNHMLTLLALVVVAAGCGRDKNRVPGGPKTPSVVQATLAEPETLPASLTYPGSVEVSHSVQSGEHSTTTTFICGTSDSLPAVAALYQQALADSSELSGSASGRMATFEMSSVDGRPGTHIVLHRQDSGTAILIMRWHCHSPSGFARRHG